MKKIALPLIPLLLTACGGSDYFSQPATDTASCLTGTWEEQNLSYPYESSLTHYNGDGTYVSEQIIDFGTPLLSTIANYSLSLIFDVPPGESYRYTVVLERGSWITEGTNLRLFNKFYATVAGNDIEDVTSQAYAKLARQEPRSGIDENAVSVHCDELYTTGKYHDVYMQTSDTPLQYTFTRDTYNSEGILTRHFQEILTLNDNGHATKRTIIQNPQSAWPDSDSTLDYEYRYSGDKIIVEGCEQSATCPTPGPSTVTEYFDRSTALLEKESFFRRVE